MTVKFQDIARYLDDPLVLVGFALFLAFGIVRLLIVRGILVPVPRSKGHSIVTRIVFLGFVLAFSVTLLGFGLEFYQQWNDSRHRLSDEQAVDKIVQLFSAALSEHSESTSTDLKGTIRDDLARFLRQVREEAAIRDEDLTDAIRGLERGEAGQLATLCLRMISPVDTGLEVRLEPYLIRSCAALVSSANFPASQRLLQLLEDGDGAVRRDSPQPQERLSSAGQPPATAASWDQVRSQPLGPHESSRLEPLQQFDVPASQQTGSGIARRDSGLEGPEFKEQPALEDAAIVPESVKLVHFGTSEPLDCYSEEIVFRQSSLGPRASVELVPLPTEGVPQPPIQIFELAQQDAAAALYRFDMGQILTKGRPFDCALHRFGILAKSASNVLISPWGSSGSVQPLHFLVYLPEGVREKPVSAVISAAGFSRSVEERAVPRYYASYRWVPRS